MADFFALTHQSESSHPNEARIPSWAVNTIKLMYFPRILRYGCGSRIKRLSGKRAQVTSGLCLEIQFVLSRLVIMWTLGSVNSKNYRNPQGPITICLEAVARKKSVAVTNPRLYLTNFEPHLLSATVWYSLWHQQTTPCIRKLHFHLETFMSTFSSL